LAGFLRPLAPFLLLSAKSVPAAEAIDEFWASASVISANQSPRDTVSRTLEYVIQHWQHKLTPFDTNWKKGSGATPLTIQDLSFGDAISIPTAPTKTHNVS
jgi:hypothetical protein